MVKQKTNTLKRFTTQEDDFLIANYMDMTLEVLGLNLNRTVGSVHGRLKRLGLEVPKEVIINRCKKAAKQNVNSGRFKPGSIPANKGRKISKEVYAKVAKTMFKKGHLPHNTLSDGTVTVRCDHKQGRPYKYIRTSLGVWEPLHRVVWVEHNGSIPKGLIVTFRDGDSLNCSIDNLELKTRQQNMTENTIQRYPPELKKAIKAVARIEKLTKD